MVAKKLNDENRQCEFAYYEFNGYEFCLYTTSKGEWVIGSMPGMKFLTEKELTVYRDALDRLHAELLVKQTLKETVCQKN